MDNFQASGFDNNLIRGVRQRPYDQASVVGLLSAGSVSDRYIKNLTADKITAGTVTASVAVGTGRAVVMNGEDGRFEVWDATTMVGFMGFMEGRFT